MKNLTNKQTVGVAILVATTIYVWGLTSDLVTTPLEILVIAISLVVSIVLLKPGNENDIINN